MATGTTPFSLILSREPPGSLTQSGTRLTNAKYNSLFSQYFKMKILDHSHNLMHEAEKKSSKACHTYEPKFDRTVRHTHRFNLDDTIYVANPPASKRCKGLTSAREGPSVKLRPKKSGPYRVVQATSHTVNVGIDELHNIVAINRVTLLQVARKVNQDAVERNCDNQSSQEYESMLSKSQSVEILNEEGAKTAPENDGLLPAAPKVAEHTNHRRGSALTIEEERQPIEYVVNQFIKSKIDGRRTLNRVQWYGHDPNDDTWELAKHLSQQFIARYKQRSPKRRRKIRQRRRCKEPWIPEQHRHPNLGQGLNEQHSVLEPVSIVVIRNAGRPMWLANSKPPGVPSFQERQTTSVAGVLPATGCPVFSRTTNDQRGRQTANRMLLLFKNSEQPTWWANSQLLGVPSFREPQTSNAAGELPAAGCPVFSGTPNNQRGGRISNRWMARLLQTRLASSCRETRHLNLQQSESPTT